MSIALKSRSPAVADKAVVFVTDGNYFRFASFAAAQIAQLNPERDFDILVVATERVEPPSGLVGRGIRFCHLETGALFDGLVLDARRTAAVYARLALPAALADDYRRLLYVDADVFVQGGDFSTLLDLDLGGCAVAAVRDNIQWRTPTRMPEAFRRRGLGHAPYLNSGVLLLDVKRFVEQAILERCLAVGQAGGAVLAWHDQDLLNVVLHGAWAELSPVWNWQYTWASMLFEAMESANIVHFIGPKKPWAHEDGKLPIRFRRAYATFIAQHYPSGAALDPAGLSPHQNRRYLRRSLVKHFISMGKLCTYLDRFDGELAVRLPDSASCLFPDRNPHASPNNGILQ